MRTRRPSITDELACLTHRERMAMLMREMRTPMALFIAATMIELKWQELRDAERGLSIAIELRDKAREQQIVHL